MPSINGQRLIDDLSTLRTFGAHGTGVIRPSLSPVDMDSRQWLMERMTEAGLEPRLDGVGNVYGQSPNPGRAVIIGSHSDTQPTGGWLDGALGVIYALEIARALGEDPTTRHLPIEPVSWMDEEGTFLGCLGSRAFTGVLTDEEVDAARDAEGTPLREALAAAGVAGRPYVRHDAARHAAYLEAHVEQGPYLEAEGNRIGVVTSIVGIRAYNVEFTGQQNHAGTTPMHARRDASTALYEFAYRINQAFPELAGDRTVWTMGKASILPGAPSIVPGRAELLLQMRDQSDALLDRLAEKAEAISSEMDTRGPVAVRLTPARQPVRPSVMAEDLREHIAAAAETHAPGKWVSMPSAAGHDPMVLHHTLPCAMLFVPSIDGISHDFAEDTAEDDIVLGCQVLATAAARIGQSLNS